MGAPGKSVVVEGGKRGVLLGGKSAVYNAEESCPACCIEFSQTWSFTDVGFIDGGQNGAYRAYDDPNDVPASPWNYINGLFGLRLRFEDDWNCRSHNPYSQFASAGATLLIPRPMILTVSWSGAGEQQNTNFELMEFWVGGNSVGKAHAPGGGLGCAPMAPVVSDPPPPQTYKLSKGSHSLYTQAETADALYHFGAYYEFQLSFKDQP